MLMTAADYRESLRRYSPKVFVNGDAVTSVADDSRLAPAIGVTYDFAHAQHQAIMTAKSAENTAPSAADEFRWPLGVEGFDAFPEIVGLT